MGKVVKLQAKPIESTDAELVRACEAWLSCLNPGQDARLSQGHFKRLIKLARAGLAERQTRPA